MKQKFRTSKDFKGLEKLNKCLQRYFDMNLLSDVRTVMDLIPNTNSNDMYLPTKNLMEYILVRMQGTAKLFEYIIGTCIELADMLNIRIQTGHFWKIGFILFSIVSRVYVLSKHCIKTVCEFYTQILPLSKLLQNTGRMWLPDSYCLPEDLKSWLNINLLRIDETEKLQSVAFTPEIISYFNLTEDSDKDVEVVDEYIFIKDSEQLNSKTNQQLTKNTTNISIHASKLLKQCAIEDVGEIIEIVPDDNAHTNSRPFPETSNQSIFKNSNIKKVKNKFLKKIKPKGYDLSGRRKCNAQYISTKQKTTSANKNIFKKQLLGKNSIVKKNNRKNKKKQ